MVQQRRVTVLKLGTMTTLSESSHDGQSSRDPYSLRSHVYKSSHPVQVRFSYALPLPYTSKQRRSNASTMRSLTRGRNACDAMR
jgi:hypothetical protein